MTKLPFQLTDPAQTSFQFLEDLSTAYWYSEVLFCAIELGLFDYIQKNYPSTAQLASLSSCKVDKLARMLTVLERLELIKKTAGRWCNAQITILYLTSQSTSYMGNFLLYRRYMQSGWRTLSQEVSQGVHDPGTSVAAEVDYDQKTYNYVRAMDQLVVQKAKEIARLLNTDAWQPPLLDVGGGTGSLGRALLRSQIENFKINTPEIHADLLELKEVLAAAYQIYGKKTDWSGINSIEGDFRHYTGAKKYGLIVLSNFLHAYSPQEAEKLLQKAISFLTPGGIILIHDYFPDRLGPSPPKGPLYDLAMMLNTFNGCCHKSSKVISWLNNAGMVKNEIRDLNTDSSVIVAGRQETASQLFVPDRTKKLEEWLYFARKAGFERAAIIKASAIITGSWVRKKCQWGCERYGQNIHCPPNGMNNEVTREMIDSYSWGVLVEGMPPGRAFHKKLLDLEKMAFLNGYHKAFAFTAGHCPVCNNCPEDGVCRFPGNARPSMEASGIDVYATAAQAGLDLQPVREKLQYVKYLGLLMLE